MSRHHNNLPKAPVNLATGSIEVTIESNPLLKLVYYNRYSNGGVPSSPNKSVGNNWTSPQLAHLSEINNMVAINFAPGRRGNTYWFKRVGKKYQPQFATRAKLSRDPESGNFRLVRANGKVSIFHSWLGSLIQTIDLNGVITEYITNPSTQQIQEIRTTSGTGAQTVVQSRLLEYFDDGPNWGQLRYVTQRRAVGVSNPTASNFTTLRRLELEYYQAFVPNRGNVNDLKHVRFQTFNNGQWEETKAQYFRYYTDSQGVGFRCGLKYALSSSEFACALQEHNPSGDANFDADLISDDDLAKVAGIGFCYNQDQRACKIMRDGGQVENTVDYFENPNPGSNQHNHWIRKAVYTASDGSIKSVYANRSGKDILIDDIDADGVRWVEYRRFNSQGKLIEKVTSSAIDMDNGPYDPAAADLNVQIKPNAGLIELTTYHQDTGKVSARLIKQGSSGVPIKLSEHDYVTHTIGSGASATSVHRIAREVNYRSAAGEPVEATYYTYELHPGTLQPSRTTTHLPNVPAGQNGVSYPQNQTTIVDFDVMGRKIRQTDARGTVTEYQYDIATGALTQQVQDVGGLNIVTDMQVDAQGRTTQTLGPVHVVDGQSVRTATWTVYKSEFETWTAKGYQTSAGENVLVNPVQISRRSADGMIRDTITAARDLTVESPGRLTQADSFPQSTWQAWSQTRSEANGRKVESRVYHQIPASGEGSVGTNYTITSGNYVYDDLGRQIAVTDAAGAITRIVYNALGQVQSTWTGSNDKGATLAKPAGNGAASNDMVLLSKNLYTDEGLLERTITPQNGDPSNDRQTRYEYDWRERQVVSIAIGPKYDHVSRRTLNNQGAVIAQETASVERSVGGAPELLISRSETRLDTRGRTYQSIQHGVDQQTGALTGETITADMHYNATGQVVKQQSGAEVTEFTYDSLGRQLTQKNGLGFTISTAYNSVGEAISQTDAMGHTTTRVYDAVGRMIETINPLNQSSGQPTFGLDGRVSVQTDPEGNATEFQYDAAGRTTRVINAEGHDTQTVYDSAGRVVKTIDALGEETSFEYDLWGRRTKVTDTMSDSVLSFYDRVGNVVTQVDSKGKSTFHQYDGLARRTQTTDRLDGISKFEFDRAGRKSAVVDSEDNATHYRYDAFGRLAQTEYPDHVLTSQRGDEDYGIVELEYDSVGRVNLRIDQTGDSVTFNYDGAGRLESRDYRTMANSPSGTIADSDVFTYDTNGQMLTATSGRYGNTVTFTYDDASRQQSEMLTLGSQSYQTQTTYDDLSRVQSLTYPDGSLVERGYNSLGQLHLLKLDSAVMDTRTYNPRGLLQQSTYGNGVVTDYQYRADGLVASIATTNSGSQKVGTYAYVYDANKNKITETILDAGFMNGFGFGESQTEYDTEDRLTAWNRDDGQQNQAWQLSLVGDWNQFSENNQPNSYVHNGVHELTEVGNFSIDHDAKGNQLQTASGIALAWDQDNRLTDAEDLSFEYDALGRRVSISDGASTKVLVCAGQQLIATYTLGSPASNPTSRFIYASYIDEPVVMLSGSQQYYYSRNQQFSITALTNATGTVVERYAYDAYGNTLVMAANGNVRTASEVDNPFAFTGRYQHPEIGLVYFRARYYSPQLGQFISRDPLGYIDGMSQYRAYFVPGGMDPSGRKCLGPPKGVVGAVRGSFSTLYIGPYTPLESESYLPGVRRGSDVTINFKPEMKKFIDKNGCSCCDKIGFIQIAKYWAKWTDGTFHSQADWEIDGGIPYPISTQSDPSKTKPQGGGSIELGDSPNALSVLSRVTSHGQRSTACVYCMSGNEGIVDGTGITLYGCVDWSTDLSYDKKSQKYSYIRSIGGTTKRGSESIQITKQGSVSMISHLAGRIAIGAN